MRGISMSSTSWQHYKRESDKTLWVHICEDRSPKYQISMAINQWHKSRLPSYRLRVVNKTSFDEIKGT